MGRSEPQNLFQLEGLEPRILLSVDSPLGAMQVGAPDELDPLFDSDSHIPPAEEVLLSHEGDTQEPSSSHSDSYDPAEQLDDIFSGLEEEDLSDDGEEDSSDSDSSVYQATPISPAQQAHISQGLEELVRLGGVLEDYDEFGAAITLIADDCSVGGLVGLSTYLVSGLDI